MVVFGTEIDENIEHKNRKDDVATANDLTGDTRETI